MKIPKFNFSELSFPELKLTDLHWSDFDVKHLIEKLGLHDVKIPNLKILGNSHLNTIAPVYLSKNIEPNYTRERITTTDGDFLDLDWVNKEHYNRPLVVLFHGAEGNSRSHYAKRLMCAIEAIGWRGVVMHFRGCSEEINLTPRFYHAGETTDIHWLLQRLRAANPQQNIFIVGVSLGGNAMLKSLGEYSDIHQLVTAAVAMSVPFDLALCTRVLDSGMNRILYAKTFLSTLMPKMSAYGERFESFATLNANLDVQSLTEFNNTYICAIYGFKDGDDYYNNSSCIHFLDTIKVPTLIFQAENDPMIPLEAWPDKAQLSNSIRFVATKSGGHAGFMATNTEDNLKESLLKLPRVILEFFDQFNAAK